MTATLNAATAEAASAWAATTAAAADVAALVAAAALTAAALDAAAPAGGGAAAPTAPGFPAGGGDPTAVWAAAGLPAARSARLEAQLAAAHGRVADAAAAARQVAAAAAAAGAAWAAAAPWVPPVEAWGGGGGSEGGRQSGEGGGRACGRSATQLGAVEVVTGLEDAAAAATRLARSAARRVGGVFEELDTYPPVLGRLGGQGASGEGRWGGGAEEVRQVGEWFALVDALRGVSETAFKFGRV
ncbi:hypothetical protein MMPV_000081 [Pyropia vietnamensis]